MTITAINPVTGSEGKRYKEMDSREVREILDRTREVFEKWRDTGFPERAVRMKRAGKILRQRKEDYARLMADEMGKPLKQGRGEIEKCAWVCDYYADCAAKFLADEVMDSNAKKSYVSYQPLGIVLAVMPWNFPFWQVFRFAAPGLMAGNAAVLKHAANVPGCALAIEEVFEQADFPKDLFRTLLIGSKDVKEVIENPLVKAVTLTGSTPAGKAVASAAGGVLKKTVLELGGSDPYVILKDADLVKAVEACVTSRLIANGQSCIAAKRFIVESIADEFTRMFVETMKTKKMGDPLEEDTDVGPQAREDLRDDLHRQVRESVGKGAKLLLGGEVPEGEGAFYPPTVLTDVTKGMPAFDEELFGPVAAIIRVKDEDEAIAVANDTIFGLGAAIFTSDERKGEKIARGEFQAGSCFVNAFVKSDPRLPFGGIKESGYGRELSRHGIREFVNVKTVYVA